MSGDLKKKPRFESWGRYPTLEAEIVHINWRSDFPQAPPLNGKLLPVGLGRSYGDVCLLEGGKLLSARSLNRFLAFDPGSGILRCEAGVSFAEILELAVPHGWFLPVTPGTKFVTLGGAIANDVHGKNHHVAGTVGNHIRRFELVRSDGSQIECSPSENREWFSATIGGLGLTGLILWAEIQLRPIVSPKIGYEGTKFHGIDEFLELSRANADAEYTVAWIDCVSGGSNFARGIFMAGEHSDSPAPLVTGKKGQITFPLDLPGIFLNRYTMRAFNELYYQKQFGKRVKALVDYEPFFYPLDAVGHWNRIYGKDGLLQFQCVLPWESGREGIIELMKATTDSGLASFLAVLKVFGDVPSPGMMSFPQPGLTLAFDFPVRGDRSFKLLNLLEDITAAHAGRMYPAKDARMKGHLFRQFYPQWQEFAHYIDPAFDSAFWKRVVQN